MGRLENYLKCILMKCNVMWLGLVIVGYSSTAWSAVVLPIEVMGAPPYNELVQVDLTATQVAESEFLWLQVHNVAYDDKARVRVNGGAWFKLWNGVPEVIVAPKDKSYGGFGGGFHTIQCTIAKAHFTLQTGTNTIEFQYPFKHDDFATAGFRVIGFNFRDGNGDNLLPPETFVWDDPTSWEPPEGRDNPVDIAAGSNVWYSAGCTDCHTQDGFDHKYFNVSNKVIIEQYKKSFFSQEQGEQVAAYIRSLPYAVVPEARPWNPPYQPGPDIETRDNAAYKWPAGAGIDAVLDTDQDMLPEMFGMENPSEEEVMQILDDYNAQPNVRTQRVSVQFPDWISWIPTTHPKDLLSETKMTALDLAYSELRANLAAGNLNRSIPSSFYNRNALYRELGQFAAKVHYAIYPYAIYPYPYTPNWTELRGISETAKRSLSAWYAVKLFEVINEFNLDTIDYVNIAEQYPFQWPIREWAVFQNAAHVIAAERAYSYFSTDLTEREQTKSIYLSSIWYQLQMVLTPGHRLGGSVMPNDYAYNLHHVHKLGYQSGTYEPIRFFQNYWLAAAQRNNGVTPKETSGGSNIVGWNMRELSPWRLYGRATPELNNGPIDLTFKELENYHYGMQGRLQSAFYRSSINVMNTFDLDQNTGDFERISLATSLQSDRTDFELEDRDAVPEYGVNNGVHRSVFQHRRTDRTGVSDSVEVDAAYTLVRLLYQDKIVSSAAYNAVKDWVDRAWDTGSWADWPTAAYTRPPLFVVNNPANGSATHAGASLSFTVDAWDDNSVVYLRLFREFPAGSDSWKFVEFDYLPPYHWNGATGENDPAGWLKNLQPGDYTFRIFATDDDGVSSSLDLNVSVDPLSDAYNSWAAANGVTGYLSDDDDGDGFDNLSEYALNGYPGPGMPVLVKQGDSFDYIYQQRNDDSHLTYTIQTTPHLVSNVWTDVATVVETNGIGGAYDEVSHVIPTNAPQSFIRLKVEYQ